MFSVGPMGWLFEPPPGGGGSPTPLPWPRQIETMLWINDLPLERTGLILQRPTGWLNDVTRILPETARVNGLTGGRYQELAPGAALDVTLTGALINITHEQLQEQLAMLKDWLSGLLELRWPHAPEFVRTGRAGPPDVVPLDPEKAFVDPDRQAWLITVTIRHADGATYLRHPRRVRLSTTPRAIEVRGLSVGGVIMLEGPLSGEVRIILESPTGVRLNELVLIIPAPEALVTDEDVCLIRLDAPHTIERHDESGEVTNVYHWRSLVPGRPWWQVSPLHADRQQRVYPRVRTSTGAGWLTYALAEAQ
jgi:hypothetical protein